MVPEDLPDLRLVEFNYGLDAVFSLFEILINLVTNVEYPKHKDRHLHHQKNDLIVNHRPKDILKLVMKPYFGGVDEAIVGRDIHIEVVKVLTCAIGWQLAQRMDSGDHIVNEIDLVVADSFVETVVLEGVVHLRDIEGRIED